jgi:glycine betaine/proline transport system ATP-binding protein
MNKTMVFITHDLSEALRLGDRIAMMRDGAVVQVGTPAQLLADPADDYVRDFIRDVPRALVLTARDICTPSEPGGGDVTRTVDAGTLLLHLIPEVAHGNPVQVVDGERVLGTVTRDAVLSAIYGAPLRGEDR